MKTFLLPIGIMLVAGLVVWSLAVLSDQPKQDKLGASIEQGISGLLQEKQEPPVALSNEGAASSQKQAVELPKEGAIPVLLDPTSVTPGGKIRVTVGALNPASVRSIEIFLQSPNDKVLRMNIWNINGEGQWYDHIPIPEDAEPGTWKVATVEITNTEGNIIPYVFGTDIFSTFRVQVQ